jgi:hypothetical protein
MPIKKLINVPPREPDRYTKLKTSTGSECWGQVVITRGPMPSGPIYLQYGQAFSKTEGWGLKHVWKKRHEEHLTHEAALSAIELLIFRVLKSGTGVWHGDQGKVAAVHSEHGTVILKLFPEKVALDGDYEWWYSITTFFDGTNAHGLRVGAIR